ncbi:MAG TPA: prolipoprotein diacylglyceryl transferase [Chitinispirillaceae bacterium]|nr:prolipoprotein diacylglyceryl transferase [Chitinispirillaceae bacterium]
MHPVILKIFSFPIHSYGLMLALSFLFGIWFSGWRAKKRGLNPDVIADMGFWIILSAILGSRLYYVFLHFDEFRGNLFSIINPFQGETVGIGGLVMLGGYIGAVIAAIIFFKVKKLPFLSYADIVSPSVGFGIMLTRIGCFLNGCCYGAASKSPLAVKFPLESPAGVYQHHIHAASLYPSQLFESLGGLAIALIVLAVGSRKTFTGFQFYLTGLLYAVLRFFVDYSRFYDTTERLFGTLSHNQVICIGLFILFSGLILKNLLFKEENSATATTIKEKQPVNEPVSTPVDNA